MIHDSLGRAELWLQGASNASDGNIESRKTLTELDKSRAISISPELLTIPEIAETVKIVEDLVAQGKWFNPKLGNRAETALECLRNFQNPMKC